MGTPSLAIKLPDDFVEEVASRVADLLRPWQSESPWLTRPEAAQYLRVSLSKLEKDKTVPSHKVGGRVLYNKTELDECIRSGLAQ